MKCTRCKETKPVAHFSNDRSRSKGKFPWCKSCVSEVRTRERKIRHQGTGEKLCLVCEEPIGGTHANRVYCSTKCKDKARSYKVYGLEPHEYRRLILSNNGKCPICRKTVKRWEIDHNHKTGETFGAVCRVCNGFLIAYSGHDPQVADRLGRFLREPPVRRLFGERRYTGPENVSQLHRMWAWNGGEHPPAEEINLESTNRSSSPPLRELHDEEADHAGRVKPPPRLRKKHAEAQDG